MNHISVSYVRVLESLWEYRNKLKETLTLPYIHYLENKIIFGFSMEFIPLDIFWSQLERFWLKGQGYLAFLKVNQSLSIFVNFSELSTKDNVIEIKL